MARNNNGAVTNYEKLNRNERVEGVRLSLTDDIQKAKVKSLYV